ncbi:flagellar biosynthesis protein FlgB [Oscillibacter sp.]|uniref:flagellar basal body rod protein FlgB n=1 Tax=Oscillibacter sp. TaxID=1945593 RepID=UPI0028B13BE5|nr:flagellar biosynthesis protein FlgB [Oscillibacter sp.]
MDYVTSNSELMMERSMRFLWTKQTAILDNISNAETPGYKTKYVTFEESLKRSLKSASGASAPAAAFRSVLDNARPAVRTASSESTRMDENGVNMTEQGVELARNTYQLRYAMNSINSNLNILRTAIKGQ